MSEIERFDVLVFGSGTGGKLTAWVSAKEGLRTAVVERGLVGGSCPNIASLPTKNVIHSAKVADFVRHGRDFGSGTAPASVDINEVRARKRRMVDGLVSMHIEKYKESGAELVFGEGSFVGPSTIEVRLRNGGVRTLHGDRVFLNLGTHAAVPDRARRAIKHGVIVETMMISRTERKPAFSIRSEFSVSTPATIKISQQIRESGLAKSTGEPNISAHPALCCRYPPCKVLLEQLTCRSQSV
jgi:pyruvate/2-oxoglutarate dehydrogenase complex dihydrolipoamide dehydrogenase (E3) component